MYHKTTPMDKVLVAMTTYPGDFEHRMILHKVLKHFRWRNGWNLKLAVLSDGVLHDPVVERYADFIIDRPGPTGVCEGEMESIRRLAAFAKERGFEVILKSAGDIIMNDDHWVSRCVRTFDEKGCRVLSTHWFDNNSWIVGTKFFVATTDFLLETFPELRYTPDVEQAFTDRIADKYALKEVAYLINSNTGEADEVEAELKAWKWEHSHRLSKFKQLDDCTPLLQRLWHKFFVYQYLRLKRDIFRTCKRLGR